MSEIKLSAAQRALELLEKMRKWEGETVVKKIVQISEDNPYRQEFNNCMAVINS